MQSDGVFHLTCYPGTATHGADVLVEVPHGATEASHFEQLRDRLIGRYSVDLKDFFHVNTDVGAPECADEVARRLHEEVGLSVWMLRSLIPRTFIDVNRGIDHGAGGRVVDGMTPGLPGYVREPADIELLTGMHSAYWKTARGAFETVCGGGGVALILHTYAPRSVSVDRVDGDIVQVLRDAYRPENLQRWPRRPPVDVISRTTEGHSLADEELIDALRRRYDEAGVPLAENHTYHLHPGTAGYEHASRYPRQVLCVEINRDELGDPWRPFEPVRIGRQGVERMSAPLAGAVGAWARR